MSRCLLAMLLAIILAMASYAVISTRTENIVTEGVPAQEDYRKADYKISVEKEDFWIALRTDPVAFFTAILAVFTAFLAGFTWNLLRVTRKGVIEQAGLTRESLLYAASSAEAAVLAAKAANRSAETAELAHTSVNRAFVALDPFIAIPTPSRGEIQSWCFSAVLRNVGNTPTKYMRTNYTIQSRDRNSPLAPIDVRDYGAIENVFLSPDRTCISMMAGENIDRMHIINCKQIRLYFWGWAEYNDIFPNTVRHRTEFAVEIEVDGDPTDRGCSFRFKVLPFHNGTDDECSRKPSPPA